MGKLKGNKSRQSYFKDDRGRLHYRQGKTHVSNKQRSRDFELVTNDIDKFEAIQSLLDSGYSCSQLGYNQGILQGDINNDGYVNVVDIILLVNIILNSEFPRTLNPCITYDVSGDGIVNILDIVRIVNLILGDTPDSTMDGWAGGFLFPQLEEGTSSLYCTDPTATNYGEICSDCDYINCCCINDGVEDEDIFDSIHRCACDGLHAPRGQFCERYDDGDFSELPPDIQAVDPKYKKPIPVSPDDSANIDDDDFQTNCESGFYCQSHSDCPYSTGNGSWYCNVVIDRTPHEAEDPLRGCCIFNEDDDGDGGDDRNSRPDETIPIYSHEFCCNYCQIQSNTTNNVNNLVRNRETEVRNSSNNTRGYGDVAWNFVGCPSIWGHVDLDGNPYINHDFNCWGDQVDPFIKPINTCGEDNYPCGEPTACLSCFPPDEIVDIEGNDRPGYEYVCNNDLNGTSWIGDKVGCDETCQASGQTCIIKPTYICAGQILSDDLVEYNTPDCNGNCLPISHDDYTGGPFCVEKTISCCLHNYPRNWFKEFNTRYVENDDIPIPGGDDVWDITAYIRNGTISAPGINGYTPMGNPGFRKIKVGDDETISGYYKPDPHSQI